MSKEKTRPEPKSTSGGLDEAIQEAMAASLAKAERSSSEDMGQLQLPFFQAAHVVPNAFLRSALFPAQDTKVERRFLDEMELFSVGDLQVTFTGKQLDQNDLDVLLAILDKSEALGNQLHFSAYSVIKALGLHPGGKQYRALHASLTRLSGGVIKVRANRRFFFGSLIEGGFGDEVSQDYVVRLNPQLGALFGLDMWSQVDRVQRKKLKRSGAAKALHGYYSSHVAPGPHRYETLAKIAGLRSADRSRLKRSIVRAHETLADPGVGFLKSYKAGPDTISVEKTTATPSQRRLAARKRAAARSRNHF